MAIGYWTGAVLLALSGPSMCQTARLISSYDSELDAGLQTHYQEALALYGALARDLAESGSAPYSDYAERYTEMSAQLETLAARVRLSDPGSAERACTLPASIAERIRGAAGGANLPAGVAEEDPDRSAGHNIASCTVIQLEMARRGLAEFQTFHYCATVERPDAPAAAITWEERCIEGRVELSELTLASARDPWIKPIEYAWIVELAKKPGAES